MCHIRSIADLRLAYGKEYFLAYGPAPIQTLTPEKEKYQTLTLK